ncbi:DUF3306 domain containing protein [Sulfitobacter noctilucae]|uniref:DUF3306 domain-containing protein n=1 Tax=Sulfitobacter noctilucae TaxID=1342302 RepID=UPI00046A0CC4|nr:DUF3306 domain-containing protein [Sulfitobacter noctilucae]KIN70321.1 DUF3306 domain containing protein [Sulfitobacter noctilucae]
MSGRSDFWARRRAGVAAEAKAEIASAEAEALAQEHAALEQMSEAEMLAALDLPAPETLGKGDDFTVFMAKTVPDLIRRRALRALWRSNPVLANVDMLVDYGEDFTDSAMAVENIQTAYQVGKGMLKHVQEMARQAEALANPVETNDVDEIEEDVLENQDDLIASSDATPEAHAPVEMAQAESPEPEAMHQPVPRRMKFRIEDAA